MPILLLSNVFFDTFVHHQAGMELPLNVIPADNILFASETVGAVRGIDPETGRHYDETKHITDEIESRSAEYREKIFHRSLHRVHPRFCRAP